ncbi:hypothetical protein HK097_004651, partial [Rhizophlyctis rosea]
MTRRDTFQHLVSWLEDVRQHGNEEIRTVLVANKADLQSRRQVSREEGESFAKKHGLLYLETSAKTGENVDEAFMNLASTIYDSLNLSRDVSDLTDADLRRLEKHGVKIGPRRPPNLLALPQGVEG